MPTNIYVDGFNLYWRRLKGTPYKWLDLGRLCSLLFPGPINRIRYFTALVESRDDDPAQQQRQQTYLRALGTIPNLSIHYGKFRTDPKWLRLVNPVAGGPTHAEVWRTVEKGSDANLATQLLVDAFNGDYDLGVVVSNDSDLNGPVEAARALKRIGVAITDERARKSSIPADAYWRIRKGLLKASQFPDEMEDRDGKFRKPDGW